eukprot:CAMPEP_0197872258 /NCGR_PEP_ID=MMETSP1439-20131203/2415_1 /TAXON_ID=66791 /ORGANISM="Gonyaulax spinifera, Strain CCMP409" /LENGTH=59 /DNA_ID=CAMNT_0043491239 /DNA_START=48 /DNA_END=223 /DNA_ORIENTATION=-
MSAPWSNGRQMTGVAKVASTTWTAPADFAIFESSSMSQRERSGFAGVSLKMSFVLGLSA